jgi:hydroxyacylglutathione hydrolase
VKALLIPVTPFQQNCSIVWDDASRLAAVVDPGGEIERIVHELDRHSLKLEKILLTHAHLDHCAGTAQLQALKSVPIEGPHRDDAFLIEELPEHARRYRFPPSATFTPDRWLSDGDEVRVGAERFSVSHCPGHTPGHVAFFNERQRHAWVGDIIFAGSVGRSDLPRGDPQQLIDSIRGKLFPLGDDVAFVPGHGPMSTFGRERQSNPFVADRLFR